MVKKSKKVLAMVLALTMITSVFAGTGAFAAYIPSAPTKASINTNFYKKDSNGVRSNVPNTSDVIGKVTYAASTDGTNVTGNGDLVVGEAYNVTIKQSKDQAAKYAIQEKASVLTELGTVGTSGNEQFVEEANMVKTVNEDETVIYTTSFVAATNSILGAGVMELAVDIDEHSTKEWGAIEYHVNDSTNQVEDAAIFTPVGKRDINDLTKDDVYFTLETKTKDPAAREGWAYSASDVKLIVFDGKGSDITTTLGVDLAATPDFKDGVNRYKLDITQLKAALAKSTAENEIKTFSLTATVTKNATAKDVVFSTAADWGQTGAKISKLPGEVVTLTYAKEVPLGDKFAGLTATKGGVAYELNQFVDENTNNVYFVMPDEGITITAKLEKIHEVKLTENVGSNDKKVDINDGSYVSITEGQPTEILMQPTDKYEFINYLNTAVKVDNTTMKGYTFTYKGMQDNGFVFDVTIDSTAKNEIFPLDGGIADYIIEKEPETMVVPVSFSQWVENGNASVKITSIGEQGKISTKSTQAEPNVVKIEYSANSVELLEAYLGDQRLVVNTDEEKPDEANIVISNAQVNKGLFKLDSKVLTGMINVNITPNNAGEVALFDGEDPLKPLNLYERFPAGKVILLQVKANDGYSLGVLNAVDAKGNKVEITKADENYDKFVMPANSSNETYGPSVTINANFESPAITSIEIKNGAPESDAAINNGYIDLKVKEAKVDEKVSFQAKPNIELNKYYIPVETKATYHQGDKEYNVPVNYVEGTWWGYSFVVPKDYLPFTEDSYIEVNTTFKKFENGWMQLENGNWIYIKDGELVTGWFKDGGSDWYYADPETGYLKTGWFNVGSKWYYSFTKEDAARGNREGAMASNQWVETNGEWYYLSADGYMETSKWVRTGNDKPWSYVDANGKAVKDTVVDGYYVDANGYCYDEV